MNRRPESSCGCTYRVVGTPPETVIDATFCKYPQMVEENRAFHAVADAYGEQGVVALSQQNSEKLTHNFVEGPACPGCASGKLTRGLRSSGVYVLAYDYSEAHQPRSIEEVPKKLCCVKCGTLISLPEVRDTTESKT